MTLKLDENQRKAVEHFEGPALVVAGPGSGKTTVIKERILNLVHKHNVAPENILAIAFTNAAADEIVNRLSSASILNHGNPKICTLHVFGKDFITNHYELLGFSKEPDIWDKKKIRQIIDRERKLLDREAQTADVTIYKVEVPATGQCYIGQTIDPDRRREEHFNRSSNSGLREALLTDDKPIFDEIEEVKGPMAYPREKYWIDSYRNRAVFNLVQGMEQVAMKSSNALVTIYKIKSLTDVIAYIGYTTDPEGIRKIIENDSTKRFAFDAIRTQVPWREAATHITNEIKKHKNWAVFNREDPERAKYSNQLRIEIFCQHFNIPYNEVLAHPEKFENLMERFDNLTEDIEKEKRRVNTGLFDPNTIEDPVLRTFAKRYESIKQDADAIDFLDMLILSADMLENYQDLLREYRNTHRYVFVDEFQDISPIDFRLIDLFSDNLFAVGDDDQAIYGFRGGDSLIMQEKFGKRENVTHYEITRNYRSTSTIVRHAKALIEHNPERIPKNLRAKNSIQSQVEVFDTPQKTAKVGEVLLRELLTTDSKEIGVLARNWRGEINDIQEILNFSELQEQGFEIGREELGDPDEKNRTKTVLRQGVKEIEILNIHTAKGREWEKVILLVNTIYNSLPDKRNDLTEERRLFYVAVTRAKQELVVLDGGNCEFVPEFQNVPLTKANIEHAIREELEKQESKLKKDLEKSSTEALIEFQHKLKNELEKVSNTVQKQNEVKLNRLRSNITRAENATAKLERNLPIALRDANENLFKDLIPVLDEFESQINNITKTVKVDNLPTDVVELHQSLQHTQQQLLDSLNNHGLKPIDARGKIFNSDHHEEILPALYSDDVPADIVLKEKRRGYVLHDQIIRKTRVTLSQGENIRIPEQLDRLTEIYLDRLISRFHANFQLTNINKSFIIRKMVQYLSGLDDGSVEKLRSFAVKDVETIGRGRFADYCVSPEKTHLCTDIVFRDFWRQMWEVVEKLRKIPESRIKQTQPSIDGSAFVDANQKNTLDEPQEKIGDFSPKIPTDGEIVKGVVVAVNRDKVMINIGFKSEGYIPASEFDTTENDLPAVQVGDEIDVYIVRREDAEGQIILSKKIADQTLIWDEIATAHETVTPVKGVVKNITAFGAFVDLGGVDGLLHKSEMVWKRISHPSEIVSIGEDIEVKVIEFDQENEKISLSLKQLTSDPWENAEEIYPIGSTIRGIVINVVDYGAFVQLEEGIDGLIHISEMPTESRDTLPLDIVNRGDEVEVIVIRISTDSRRISLRMITNLSTSFGDSQSDPTSDIPVPTEKIKGTISGDPPELITLTPIEDMEDTLPVPEEPSFDEETNSTTPCEPINPIDIQPIEETVDISPPMSEKLSEILNSQIQNLKPEMPETETSSKSPKTTNDNPDTTLQKSKEILKAQIQNLKPAPIEKTDPPIEIVNNVSNRPTAPTYSEPPEKTNNNPSNIEISHQEKLLKNEIQEKQKNFRYYLRKFGRLVLRKSKLQ